MFNGIIKNKGIIKKVIKNGDDFMIEVISDLKLSKKNIGDSISCSGVCLTLVNIKKKILCFFISNETLKKSNFKFVKKDDLLNLELAMKYGQHISGHFVQGHIDFSEKVVKKKYVGKTCFFQIKFPPRYKTYFIFKGSIALNGISLTITKIFDSKFEVSVIPHTLNQTNLSMLQINDIVNIEIDIISKYLFNFRNEKF